MCIINASSSDKRRASQLRSRRAMFIGSGGAVNLPALALKIMLSIIILLHPSRLWIVIIIIDIECDLSGGEGEKETRINFHSFFFLLFFNNFH